MKKLLTITILSSFLFALSPKQISVLKQVKQIARNNGFSNFQNSICAISLTETSAGDGGLIGDSYYTNGKIKPLVERSLGLNQVKLLTAQIVIKKFKLKRYYFLVSKPGVYKKYSKYLFELKRFETIYNNPIWQKRWARGIGLKTKRWVQRNIRYYKAKLRKYRKYYKKDNLLASTLLSDLKFNTLIALYYLKMNYEIAKQKGFKHPWRVAISRYNGGNYNPKYLRKIEKNLKICYNIK